MNKAVLQELEFEKNKREILKQNSTVATEKVKMDSTRKYAWELELEQYKKQKRLARFHTFGAILGILSFVLTLILNYSKILEILMKL